MKITLTIPDDAVPAWEKRVAEFNAGSGQPPVSIEQFNQLILDEETARHVAAKRDADVASMKPIADALLVANETTRNDVIGYAKQQLGLL